MIYKLDRNGIKKELISFGKTEYGKTMFVICYSLFLILLLTIIISFIFKVLCAELFIALVFLCLISFLVGSYSYYKEIRIFVNSKNKE